MNKPVFLPIHTDKDVTAGYVVYPMVIYHNATVAKIVHASVQVAASVNDRMARLEADPARAAALSKARSRMGQWLEKESPATHGLAALRLKAGLSQNTLALRLGTQQSNVSRWEKEPGDMQFSTIKNLTKALGVSLNDVLQALESSNLKKEANHG